MCGHTLSHIDTHVSTTHADSKNSKIVQLKCFASSNIAIPGAKIAFWMFFFFVALRNVIETSCETNKGWFPEKIGREKFYGSGVTFLDAFPAPARVTFCHFFRGPLSPPLPPGPHPPPLPEWSTVWMTPHYTIITDRKENILEIVRTFSSFFPLQITSD